MKELDAKNIGIIRKGYTEMSQSLCGMSDLLDEPFKGTYLTMKKGFDDFLAGLPPTDQVPAALDVNAMMQSMLSQMIGMSSMCSSFCSKMNEMKAGYAGRVEAAVAGALASGVDAEITRRITDGQLFDAAGVEAKIAGAKKDLIPKTEAESLCSAARQAGITEGKAAAATEAQALAAQKAVIETRKVSLATAAIPLPFDSIDALLAGTDVEFEARRAEAEARLTELKGLGVAYNSADPIWGRVWGPKADYESFLSISKAAFAGREDVDVFALGSKRTSSAPPKGFIG